MSRSGSNSGISRREALKRGAAVAGAAVWVAPTVQALSMSAASAATPSGAGDGGGVGGSKRATTRGKGTGIVQSGGRANEHAGG